MNATDFQTTAAAITTLDRAAVGTVEPGPGAGRPARALVAGPEVAVRWQVTDAATCALFAAAQQGDHAAREQLILKYAPLVKWAASRMASALASHLTIDDLTSYGLFGLIDAIDRFDPSRQVPFAAYAATRIRGAVIDELRKADWAPRSVRSSLRELNDMVAQLTHELGRTPDDVEVADELGWTRDKLQTVRGQYQRSQVSSIDTHAAARDDAADMITLADTLAVLSAATRSSMLRTVTKLRI